MLNNKMFRVTSFVCVCIRIRIYQSVYCRDKYSVIKILKDQHLEIMLINGDYTLGWTDLLF